MVKIEFKSYKKEVLREHKAGLERGLQAIALAWQKNVTPIVPVDTGKLRQSMKYDVQVKNKQVVVGSTVKEPPYSIFVELGTSKMAAQPYLRPSIENNVAEYENVFNTNYSK